MPKLEIALIGTFYGRHENSLPILKRLFVDCSRRPTEAWFMCETDEDEAALIEAWDYLYEVEMVEKWPKQARIIVLPTPRGEGDYAEIPYSRKINYALERTNADLICYLDNGSMPHERKFEVMAGALEKNPDWGAVYCTQERTGYLHEHFYAQEIVHDAYCQLNYTQVMHRRTADRWPLSMSLARPDLADATFWRSLHASLGAFYPAGGDRIHDFHNMEHP